MRDLVWLIVLAGCVEPRPESGTPNKPAYHYVVDHITFAKPQAFYGLDLDSDGSADNNLGEAFIMLATWGFQHEPSTAAAVDKGAQLTLLELASTDLVNSSDSDLSVLVGTSATPTPCRDANDTTCRRHLDGTGSFTASPSNAPALDGRVVAGRFDGGPGRAIIQLTFWGGTPVTIRLVAARTELLAFDETTIMDGMLGGAITDTEMEQTVLPAMRDGLMTFVTRDCDPTSSTLNCGCLPDTDGKTVIGTFDISPRNCVIEVSDLRAHPYLPYLATPDLVIDSQPAFSAAIRFSAVAATFD